MATMSDPKAIDPRENVEARRNDDVVGCAGWSLPSILAPYNEVQLHLPSVLRPSVRNSTNLKTR